MATRYYVIVDNIEANNQQCLSAKNFYNVDTELEDPLLLQSAQNLPKIIAVVSAAPQQPVSTYQPDDNASLILQPLQHTQEIVAVTTDGEQPSTSLLQDVSRVTTAVINTSGKSKEEQEEEIIIESSSNRESNVVVVQGSMEEDDDEDNVSMTGDENVSPNTSRKRSVGKEDFELMKSKKRHASSEMKFRAFNINWSKVTDNILERLHRLQDYRDKNPGKSVPLSIQLPKTDMSNLTNMIVDQLRCIDAEIPAVTMEAVARQVYTKYSGLQFIDDDGCVNLQSHVSFKHKLINRNSYLNRFKNPDERKISTAEIRRNKNLKAGTLAEYWKASSKNCVKDIITKLVRDDPKILTEEFLSASQSYVRFRLDERKPLKEIIAGFPIIRRRQLISFHFGKATGVPIDEMKKLFVAKRSKIIDFLRSRPKNTLNEAPSDRDIIASLCSLLGESVAELIIQKEIGTKALEITTGCAGPVIVAVDLGNGNNVFYVFAEQVQLTEGTKDVVTAVAELLAVHYIYNFMYMKGISKILEFIQAYFFKIIPTTGSKSKATRKSKQQRLVQSIIEAISSHVPVTTQPVD